MKIKIEIPNLRATINSVKKDKEIKEARIRALVIKTGLKIQGTAKVNQSTHVDTGVLRNSIDMSTALEDGVTEVEVGSNVKYAGYHEAAYPYLTPAALEHRQQFLQSIQSIMSK